LESLPAANKGIKSYLPIEREDSYRTPLKEREDHGTSERKAMAYARELPFESTVNAWLALLTLPPLKELEALALVDQSKEYSGKKTKERQD
jgi:hypothetical protein